MQPDYSTSPNRAKWPSEHWGTAEHAGRHYIITVNADGSVPISSKIVCEIAEANEDRLKGLLACPEMAAALLAMHPHLVRNARVLGDTQTEPFLRQVEAALRKAGAL